MKVQFIIILKERTKNCLWSSVRLYTLRYNYIVMFCQQKKGSVSMILDKAVVDAIAGEPYGTIIPCSYAVGSRRKLKIKLIPNEKRISQNDK